MRLARLLVAAMLLLAIYTPSTTALASSEPVAPIPWRTLSNGAPSDPNSVRMGTILTNSNHYALTTWYSVVKLFDVPSQSRSYYLDLGGVDELSIRPVASEALALAVSLKTGLHDPLVVGVGLDDAEQKTAKLVRSLAHSHRSSRTGGWGNSWQSALWAALAGQAGWLMWDSKHLSSSDRRKIQNMVAYEANRFIGYRVPYYQAPSGAVITRGDSKAEENSWNAMVLQLATAMMPSSRKYHAWTYKAHELMISAFAVPRDVRSSATVSGRSLADWLAGSNANPDSTVVNHNIVHPDYMTTISHNTFAALNYSLVRRPTPSAAFFNSSKVYGAFSRLHFTAGARLASGGRAASPGGPIYKGGSPDIYYPQGYDWGPDRRIHFALADAQAHAFGYDNLSRQRGSYWEEHHAQVVLDQQNLHVDKRAYTTSDQDSYSGREEYVALCAAQAYLTKWLIHQNAFSRTTTPIPLVINAQDRDFSTPSGSWASSSPVDRLGVTTRSTRPGSGSSRARFTPKITQAGRYTVYAWWPVNRDHATNTPFVVRHKYGTVRLLRDQTTGGGRWNVLGTYYFRAGSGGFVEINNRADGTVIADSVMLSYGG